MKSNLWLIIVIFISFLFALFAIQLIVDYFIETSGEVSAENVLLMKPS